MPRIVFQFDGNEHHARNYHVFRGKKIEFRPTRAYTTTTVRNGMYVIPAETRRESTTVCGVFVDGKKVAKGVSEDGGWLVGGRWIADRMYVDDLPYTLEGRTLPAEWSEERPSPCIFCGKKVLHVNGGGNAWVGGTRVGDKKEYFLYCNAECSPEAYDRDAVWTCWKCGVDVVGDACVGCGGPRSEFDNALPGRGVK